MQHLGVQVQQTGPPLKLLEAQAHRGFAHVDEKSLEDLLVHCDRALPDCDADDLHRRTDLILAAIAAIKPDMTDVEAAACVARCFVEENPDCYAELLVDAEALSDVVNAGEAKKVAEFVAATSQMQAQKEVVMDTRDRRLHKHFKKSAAPKYSAMQRKVPRWLPPRDESSSSSVTAWIVKHAPSSANVICDDYNGRWRVISQNLDWRSISWTKRGYRKAAFEVLHQAWLYHKDFTGQGAPYDIASLEQEWVTAEPSMQR